MGDLGFEPRTSGLRVRCATVALVTQAVILAQVLAKEYNQRQHQLPWFLESKLFPIIKSEFL